MKDSTPKSEMISIRISPMMRRQLDNLIERWGEPQSDAIRRAVMIAWGFEFMGTKEQKEALRNADDSMQKLMNSLFTPVDVQSDAKAIANEILGKKKVP